MKTVEAEVERVRRRVAVKDQKLSAVLDSVAMELDALISELEVGENIEEASGENRGECEPVAGGSNGIGSPKLEFHRVVRFRCDRIGGLKALSAIKNHHKEFFTFVSKLGKTLDKAVKPIPKSINFAFSGLEREFHNLVQEHHKDLFKSINPESPQAKSVVLYEELEKSLSERDILEALSRYEKYNESLKLIDSEFKINLCKMGFLQLSQQRKFNQAVQLLREKISRPSTHMAEEMGELIHCVCYSHDQLPPKRLSFAHDFDSLLVKCIKQVSRAIRKLKGLPEISTFLQIISAGLNALPQHLAQKDVWEENEDDQEIHVTIELPKDMIHHSVIYCPISKDVCDPKTNVPLLQNCGHIVGQASVKKMGEASRGRSLVATIHFKCPTCPNQQTQSSMKPVLY